MESLNRLTLTLPERFRRRASSDGLPNFSSAPRSAQKKGEHPKDGLGDDITSSLHPIASNFSPMPSDRPSKLGSPRLSHLCAICDKVFKRDKQLAGTLSSTQKPHQQYHHSGSSLKISAERGCHMCRRLWEEIGDKHAAITAAIPKNSTVVEPLSTYNILNGSDGARYTIRFAYKINGTDLRAWLDMTPTAGRLIGQHSTSTGSQATIDTALSWLQTCDRAHTCRHVHRNSPSMLPKRLLEVGDSLILRDVCDLPPEATYITLSYCWGDGSVTKLMKGSLADFKKSIPLKSLPLTIQHAVSVTKSLGVRHLWVDSLCIVQDSTEEWLVESAKMGGIFENSYCTLAATASCHSGEGMFRGRSLSDTSPCTVSATWEGLKKGVYYLPPRNEWTRQIMEAPLNKRGWVLQERLLSSRILHFAANQVYWSCQELCGSENYPNPLRMSVEENEDASRSWDLGSSNRQAPSDTLERDCWMIWAKIVRRYSNCNLTYGSDKLVAISGLVELVHRRFGGHVDYLAGLWSWNLGGQLLWESAGTGRHQRPEIYRAPSWSWASVDGAVSLNRPRAIGRRRGDKFCLRIDVLDARTTPTAGPFGQITDAFIRIRGRIFPVTLHPPGTQDDISSDRWSNYKACFAGRPRSLQWFKISVNADEDVDGIRPGQLSQRDLFCVPVESELWKTMESQDDEDEEEDSNDDRRSVREIYDVRAEELSRYRYSMSGLLLFPTGRRKGEYQRLGVFRNDDRENKFHGCMKTYYQSHVQQFDEFEEDHGGGIFTFTIV